jgi:sugar phosphate isomerase/epimerase
LEACGDEEEADVQTAIATVSLSGTLNEKLEAIAKAQFRGVEIFENDLLSFNGTPTEIRRMIEDLGLRTITFQPFRDFEGTLEPQRTKVFARAERKFDVMQELGWRVRRFSKIPAVGESKTTNFNLARADEVTE